MGTLNLHFIVPVLKGVDDQGNKFLVSSDLPGVAIQVVYHLKNSSNNTSVRALRTMPFGVGKLTDSFCISYPFFKRKVALCSSFRSSLVHIFEISSSDYKQNIRHISETLRRSCSPHYFASVCEMVWVHLIKECF